MNSRRISMWSGPRNISTAIMYSFRQRTDTTVVDEPLYGHYLRTTGVRHPGDAEVIAHMNCDAKRVIQDTLLATGPTAIRFYKNMAHHLTGLELGFLSKLENILLIRDPREMLPSLAQQIPEPSLRDTGLGEQVTILEKLLEQEQEPIVLDARELLLNPRGVLSVLCQKLRLSFEEQMLAWEAGPKAEDGVWARYWYQNVHQSTGFEAYQAKTTPFPETLSPLLQDCQPLYDQLYTHAIRVP